MSVAAAETVKEDKDLQPQPEKPLEMQVVESADPLPIDIDASVIDDNPILKVTRNRIREMAAIGQSIESLGTVRINNGALLITKEHLIHFMQKCKEYSDQDGTGEGVKVFGKVAATLANSLARVSKEFRSQNNVMPYQKPRRKDAGFEPGQKVLMTGNNIHIHNK